MWAAAAAAAAAAEGSKLAESGTRQVSPSRHPHPHRRHHLPEGHPSKVRLPPTS